MLQAKKYCEIAASADKFVYVKVDLQNHPDVYKLIVSTSPLDVAFSNLTANFCMALLESPAPVETSNAPKPTATGTKMDEKVPPVAAAAPKTDNIDDSGAIMIVDVHTGPVTVIACTSKLIPMVQLP